jgi:hypothetical protein
MMRNRQFWSPCCSHWKLSISDAHPVFSILFYSADSVVPSIALELTLAALVLVVGIFWTTLDMTQRHEVTPSNLQDWMSLAHEKGYLINMFDFGGKF